MIYKNLFYNACVYKFDRYCTIFSTSIRHCLSSINTLSHMEIRSTKSLEHRYKSDKALLNSTFFLSDKFYKSQLSEEDWSGNTLGYN